MSFSLRGTRDASRSIRERYEEAMITSPMTKGHGPLRDLSHQQDDIPL